MRNGNFGALQFKIKVKNSVSRYQICPLFLKEKGCPAPTSLVFAMQKESDESESCSLQSCIEDQNHLESSDGSHDLDLEVSSITLSEAYLSQSAESLGNQGNLLDKLKAVHLHILAMEQWNASRIQLCHRYIYFRFSNLKFYTEIYFSTLLIEQIHFTVLVNLFCLDMEVLVLASSPN